MLQTQMKFPVKGEFYITVIDIMKQFNMNESEDFKSMNKNAYKRLVKEKCTKAALDYLLEKQARGSKGEGIKYTVLQMADYLMPQSNISVKDQRELFSIRCRANN